jgi:hypothetical protein
MPILISRRALLATSATATTALLAPRVLRSASHSQAPKVPKLLDHILLGCNDLDRGITFVEQHTGVRAAFGGVHPGRGTQNALLSLGALGERRYLEIIAPDPKQPGVTSRGGDLRSITNPSLVGWAAHPAAIGNTAKRLTDAAIPHTGPTAGSRRKPDGTTLHWATIDLADDRAGLLPFFIQWSPDSRHPSLDAPQGCRLTQFTVSSSDSDKLTAFFQSIDLEVPIERAERPYLSALIEGPGGTLRLSS